MNVAYLGPLKDYSGYGEANRHAAAALDAAGVNVLGKLVSYSQEASDFGSLGILINELCEREGRYKIKILHVTPDQYGRYKDETPGIYHIGHFFWETDRVPVEFVEGLNSVDEIWTGSQANYDALQRSGVTVPIFVYPQALETNREWPEPYELPAIPDDVYKFYSVFEWTDRKNPEGLLNAYWQEFAGEEKVALIIKTYFRNFTLSNRKMIRQQIEILKAKSGIKNPPKVFLYLDLMDRQQIMRLHKTGDCYVSPHRGEGWGLPIVEAALAGSPAIATVYGGAAEWMAKDSAIMGLDFNMVPLTGMAHSQRWYTHDQKWADPDPAALRANMRIAFDRGPEAKKMAKVGQDFVIDRFNLLRVGNEMAARLQEIEGGLS